MSNVVEESEIQEILQPVEADLLRQTEGVGVGWFGRAATALFRAYQIASYFSGADGGGSEVILPAISCATLANAALLAGVTPRFADVDPATGMPTLRTIQQRWTGNTCAVVFIHLFGQTADLRPLARWCQAKNILLIEDIAQALGARLPDEGSVGSVGDLSVYSFSPTKILECGGGALVIRTKDLVSASKELSAATPLPQQINDEKATILGLSYRNLHHSLVGLVRQRAIDDVSLAFLKLQPAFRGLYLRAMKDPSALLNAWPRLPEMVRYRYHNAEKYDALMGTGPWTRLIQWRQSGVCWRYSLLVDFPEKLVPFSEAVRKEGFHVSNLYWPVNDFFRPGDACPSAERFARRVVNLWVDRSVDQNWVTRCAESMLRNAERFAA